MSVCRLCPRECKVDREKSLGVCGAGSKIKIAKYMLHMWEEPCISGQRGSGAIFFSHCPLKCVYCQNRDISHGGDGVEISVQRLCEIFFELKDVFNNSVPTINKYSLRLDGRL